VALAAFLVGASFAYFGWQSRAAEPAPPPAAVPVVAATITCRDVPTAFRRLWAAGVGRRREQASEPQRVGSPSAPPTEPDINSRLRDMGPTEPEDFAVTDGLCATGRA
jgi:hypothetical protein